MLASLIHQFALIDGIALAWFLLCWFGYAYLGDRQGFRSGGLVGLSHHYRLAWARRLLKRDVHITDAALVGNLMQSVSFYANTTIYIIAGLVAVLGAVDKVISVAAELPFAKGVSKEVWEFKVLLLLGVFVVAYFKFTWAIRQLNFLSILIGATPVDETDPAEREAFIQKTAALNTYSGDEFNRGIRAYYFGIAALFWVVAPSLFMVVTTAIVFVLYRRDYHSATYRTLRAGVAKPD